MIINKTEQEKREAIIANAGKSIFVEAGAGAGKTTLIVQRVTNQIRHGFLKPEELVVITFTNKAAGELFERIRKSFEDEEQNPANTKEQRDRFVYAIEHIEQIHISTIHSFCFSLLRERCFEAKLPLEVGMLENEENIQRQKKFFANWLAQLDMSSIDEIKKALTLFGGNSFYYGEKLEEFFIKICEKPNDVNFVALSDTQLKQLETEIDTCIANADVFLKQLNSEIDTIHKKGIEIYERVTGDPFILVNDGLKLKTFYEYMGEEFPGKGSRATTYINNVKKLYSSDEVSLCVKGKLKAQKEIYAKANEEFSMWLDNNIRPNNLFEKWRTQEEQKKEKTTGYVYFVLLKYAVKARLDYLKALDNLMLSNEQLIQKAKDLVCNHKDAHAYFSNKYKCIYVDEFQDTDHIQAELVWKLASDENGKLKSGALFVVGDPKQAIYRFRGGEPAVYNQIKKRMIDDTAAEVYELDYNFRSNKEVIGWVNNQFKSKITESGIAYRNMECVSQNYAEKPDAEAKAIKGVYHFNTLGNNKFRNTADKAVYEAEKLAALINKLVSNGYKIYRTTKNENGYERVLQPVNYGDFLILCWDTTQMEYYIDVMKKASIPVDLAGKTDIDKSRVLKNFLAIYRFMIQPMDDKSRQGASQVVCRKGVNGDEDVTTQRLNHIYESVKYMNCHGKAQFLLKHPEYILPWDKEISKEDIYSIQGRLHQMVECVFSQAKEEPEQILKYFENYFLNKLEHELMLTKDSKAVRFMNLHKAKGLEGGITILTNRKSQKKDRIPEYTSSEKNQNQEYDYYGCISDNFSVMHGYNCNEESKKLLQVAKTEDEAEKIRLEYVAATRAKEVLIVTQEYGSEAPFSRYEKPENDIESIFEGKTKAESESEDVSKVDAGVIQEITDAAKKGVYISLSPSGLEGIVREADDEDIDVTAENAEESDVKGNNAEGNNAKDISLIKKQYPRRPRGNIFGTTMHRSFELLISQKMDISVCVAQAIIENYDDLLQEGVRRYLEPGEEKNVYIQAVKEYLEGILEKFNKNEHINTLLSNAKEIHTELPFSYYVSLQDSAELFRDIKVHLEKNKISIEENQPVWINGTADLVVIDNNNCVHIIDFKSDTNYEETIEDFETVLYEKYKGQLLLYKYAMSRIFEVELEKISTELYHLYK